MRREFLVERLDRFQEYVPHDGDGMRAAMRERILPRVPIRAGEIDDIRCGNAILQEWRVVVDYPTPRARKMSAVPQLLRLLPHQTLQPRRRRRVPRQASPTKRIKDKVTEGCWFGRIRDGAHQDTAISGGPERAELICLAHTKANAAR